MDDRKKLPIGYSNFKEVIEKDLYYVDKTKGIEELLDNKNKVILFPRPRRFGKSLFISTLDNFFNIEYKKNNKNLFKDLYISKSKYYNELSKYPVINISFKELKGNIYDNTYKGISGIISNLYNEKLYLMKNLNEKEKEKFRSVWLEKCDEITLQQSIKDLSSYLYNYYKKEVIILIDEYDVPIQDGYLKGYYNEVVNLIRNIFSSALKDNNNIKFAVMTGVLRVSRESLFSDLNNVKVYGIIDSDYNEYFGFTKEETKILLEYYGLKLNKEVKNMYDGYNFNGVSIYNPWSIINYASDKILIPYWINTSGNDLIKDTIRKSNDNIRVSIEKLITGEELTLRYNDKITFLDLKKNSSLNTILNFLLISGYLTITDSFDIRETNNKVVIPNNEIKNMFVSMLDSFLLDDNNLNNDLTYDFSEAFISKDKNKIEDILNEVLNSVSFYDTGENFYHGYMLGLFTYFLNNDKYILKSNREAGSGRFDIMIETVDRKLGIIIELKITKEDKMERVAKKALKQIEDKEYYKELVLDKVEVIDKYVMIFKEKKCIVR